MAFCAVAAVVVIMLLDGGAFAKKCCEDYPVAAGTWPTFQGDGGRKGVADMDLPGLPYRRKWTFDLGPHTWNYQRGSSVWSSCAVGALVGGNPHVFIGAYDRNLYNIDARSGDELWRFTTGAGINAAPAFAVVEERPMIFFASADRSFYALDARSGEKLWQYETYPWSYTAGESAAGSPVVATTLYREVLFGTMWNNDHRPLRTEQNGEIFALDAKSGELIWKERISGSRLTSPSWMMVDDRPTVFVASEDGSLHALDARDGTRLWRHIGDGGIAASPVAARVEGMPAVITANRFGMLRFISARTGAEIWSYKAGHEILSTPAVACFDGRVVILFGAGDRCVHAVCGQRGIKLWKFQTGKYVVASTAVATVKGRPTAFINSLDNKIYALDLFTGRELMRFAAGDMLWPYETRGISIWSSPSLISLGDGESLLLYPAHDGKIYAFTTRTFGENPTPEDAALVSASLDGDMSDGRRAGPRGALWYFPPVLGAALFAAGLTITIIKRR